jgi:hypothetical protein
MSQDLSEVFERAIKQDGSATDFDRIETRACTSDNFDGVQYNIYGRFIPIRPVIDVVTEVDGHAIEQLHHTDDGDPHLGVFVADIPEQPHPAFITGRY